MDVSHSSAVHLPSSWCRQLARIPGLTAATDRCGVRWAPPDRRPGPGSWQCRDR